MTRGVKRTEPLPPCIDCGEQPMRHVSLGWCQRCYNHAVAEGRHVPKPRRGTGYCEVCPERVHAHGYCVVHYYRWRDHGDPLGGGTYDGEPLEFLRSVVDGPVTDECIPWPYAGAVRGRGVVTFRGEQMNAARAALIMFTGIDPPDLEACHGPCSIKALCVNAPGGHVYWGTHLDNVSKDKVRDGTAPRGANHPMAKLWPHQVNMIRQAIAAGEPTVKVATKWGISPKHVNAIIAGTRWAHLPAKRVIYRRSST
jgi:hypothetical protein